MTPFTALYRKEFREHRTSFFFMLGCLALCVLLPIGIKGSPTNGILVSYFYLYGFYVTAIAAMSYAKEEENKTSRFLRSLPVASGTILLAKLAWLGTVMLVLILPVVPQLWFPFVNIHGLYGIGVGIRFYFVNGAFGLGFLTLFSLISWGYFWTTRYPSKLFATLLSYCCVFITWLLVGWFALDFATRYYGGKLEYGSKILMLGAVFLISLVVAVLGLWRAAKFYDRAEPETKPEAFLNSPRKDNDRRVRFVTRFFPKDRWTPFQALLWQAICQSRDILFLGLGTAVAFALWQMFFSERFFAVMSGVTYSGDGEAPNWNWYVQILGLGIICTGFLVAFGLGSSIFAQDQERGMYRALGHRGVPARLVWWSRVLPFLAVILMPVPFIVRIALGLSPGNSLQTTLFTSMFLVFYFAAFCFGTFYSLLLRNVLASILATFGTWLFYMWGMAIGGQICFEEFRIDLPPTLCAAILIVIPLLFLVASRLMCASWLREEPWTRRWPVPAMVLAAFVLYAFGPLTVYAFCELLHYLTGTRTMIITM